MNKKYSIGLSLLLMFGLLSGCDNIADVNNGEIEVDVSGTVWDGNVRYAQVRMVPIDQYGQIPRDEDTNPIGQVLKTDGNGEIKLLNSSYQYEQAQIRATLHRDEILVLVTVDSFTEKVGDQIIQRSTEVRCPLAAGCLNDQGESVQLNEWFKPDASFELWAILHEVPDAIDMHVTPLTHLAAKLSLADYVSDGTACTNDNCSADILKNGMTTPELVYEAKGRIQRQLSLDSGFASAIAPFSFELDSVIQLDAAKQFLLGASVFKQMKDQTLTLAGALDWWVNSYLSNKGQFYEDDQTNDPKQLDLKTWFEDVVALETEFDNSDLSNSTYEAAAAVYSSILSSTDPAIGLTANDITNVLGEELPIGENEVPVSDQITAAKTLVGNVQTWLLDLDNHDYVSFFDQDVHDDLTEMGSKWKDYRTHLAPVMQELFLPMVQLVEYGLTCIRGVDACDATHALATQDLDSVDGVDVTYTSSGESLTYRVNQSTGNFPKIILQGRFETSEGQLDNVKKFVFTGTNSIETSDGKVTLETVNDVNPQLTFTLQSAPTEGEAIDIRKMVMALPKLTATAKEGDGSTMDIRYTIEELGAILLGTLDVTRPDEPVHYNIEAIEFTGTVIEGSGDNQERIVTTLTANSTNADIYYSPTRFPNLDFGFDNEALKTFGRFGGADTSNGRFAGWLEMPSNVVLGETLSSEVQYVEESTYENLDEGLQSLLELSLAAEVQYGALEYSGGKTALVIWKDSASDEEAQARQCVEVSDVWGCFTALPLKNLGCGNDYGQADATIGQAFGYLQTEGCIAQVNIEGRGIYDIQYPDSNFISGEAPYDVVLNEPHTLGLSSFNARSVSFFKQSDPENPGQLVDGKRVLFDVTGAATDSENITLGLALTHDYQGAGGSELAFFDFVPYGERTLWFAVGTNPNETDVLVYYILQDNVTLTVSAFDYTNEDPTDENSIDRNPDHDEPLGYLRYDGKLLGTLRQEGDLYVVRYIDGSWLVL